MVCNGHFESKGITGGAITKDVDARPTYNRSIQVRNGGRLRPKWRGPVEEGPMPRVDRVYPTHAGKAQLFQLGGEVKADRGACRVCNARFAVAQIDQRSDRGADAAGDLVNVG